MKTPGRSVSGVAVVYAGSVGGLFIAEVFLARNSNAGQFGAYQAVRQSLPFAVMIVVFGLDQAIARAAASGALGSTAYQAVRNRLLAALPAAAIFALALYLAIGLDNLTVFLAAAALPGVVVSELASAILRGSGRYGLSILLQQGYRLLLAVLIALALVSSYSLPAAFLVGLLLAGTILPSGVGARILMRQAKKRNGRGLPVTGLGAAFAFSMVSVAALDALDVILAVRVGGSLAVGGEYSASKLMITYPLIAFASIAGFILMPELAKRSDRSSNWLTARKVCLAFLGSGLIACALALPAVRAVEWVVSIQLKTWQGFAFVLIGALRLLYVFPSSLLGAYGTNRVIVRASLFALPAPVILVALSVLPWALTGYSSVLVAVCVATVYRVAVAVWFGRLALEERDA